MLGNISCFLLSADFFQNQVFFKIISGISSGYQTVCIPDQAKVLLGLIWIQTVCKGYQQTIKFAVSKELK